MEMDEWITQPEKDSSRKEKKIIRQRKISGRRFVPIIAHDYCNSTVELLDSSLITSLHLKYLQSIPSPVVSILIKAWNETDLEIQ